VYGIKAAVRRLDFAPETKDMKVVDIKTGRFVFQPRPDKPVSLADLRASIVKAGYEIEGTRIEVSGTLTDDGRLRVPETGQVFRLEGEARLRDRLRETAGAAGRVLAAGTWKVTDRQETILLDGPRTEEKHP
jgi:hypothetical protein